MKRDMDLVRSILLDLESLPTPSQGYYFLEGADEDAFDHSMKVMLDQGLIEAQKWGTHDRPRGRWHAMVRLTWAGHDFLDTIRDDEVWQKTKAGVKAAGGFSFDLMKALAKGLIKKKIEAHTGIELEL